MELFPVLLLAGVFVVLLLLGVPIAFAIGLASVATMVLTIPALPALTTGAQRIATGLDSFVLLAIPLFILAGQLMNRGGSARRLIALARVLVGWLPGSLAYINIVAAVLFGAISGSAAAAAAAIGGFMNPLMRAERYDRGYSAAVNITSATTGLVIPPSNILIVYSLASGGVSIAALFLAGYLPGLIVALALMTVAGITAVRRGYPRGTFGGIREAVVRFLDAVPSLFLLVVVIGGIVAGLFTATEASAVAVLYTLILSVVIYREVAPRDLPRILLDTATTTAVVMLLVGTSMGLSWVMAHENIPQTVATTLIGISDHPLMILLAINVTLLAVGTFMDITPAVLIFTPIFLPVVVELGMDPVHFGIVMVVNLCVGLCTPPVGTVLFVGCGVAQTSITEVIRPLLPLYLAMVAALVVITAFPWLSLALPRAFGF